MNTNLPNNPNWPDFSPLIDLQKRLQEIVSPLQELSLKIQESMSPVIETVQIFRDKFQEMAQTLAETANLSEAITKLEENQYVYWEYLDSEFVDEVLEAQDINKLLSQKIVDDKYQMVNITIKKSKDNPALQKRLRLYKQSVSAFKQGNTDLAVNGFTSIVDGLLADVSGNETHKLSPRINAILDKLDSDTVLDTEEYAMLTFAFTFEKTLHSFTETAPFTEPEPKGLNRHWIAHGRSTRKKTKLDCVKLINLIYGILLIDESAKKDGEGADE